MKVKCLQQSSLRRSVGEAFCESTSRGVEHWDADIHSYVGYDCVHFAGIESKPFLVITTRRTGLCGTLK